jgi:hypothetical protein
MVNAYVEVLIKPQKKAAIYMVSAWAQQNSLVLGQVKVDRAIGLKLPQ